MSVEGRHPGLEPQLHVHGSLPQRQLVLQHRVPVFASHVRLVAQGFVIGRGSGAGREARREDQPQVSLFHSPF